MAEDDFHWHDILNEAEKDVNDYHIPGREDEKWLNIVNLISFLKRSEEKKDKIRYMSAASRSMVDWHSYMVSFCVIMRCKC